jgi:hypothetical protein
MIIPDKLLVEGHVIDITFLEEDDILEVKGKLVNGCIDKQYCKMVLNKNAARSVLEETFIHEILHLCECQYHILKEPVLDGLARRLYSILKNNNLLREDDSIEGEKIDTVELDNIVESKDDNTEESENGN